MFKQCWAEYKEWLEDQWESAWDVLSDSFVIFIIAVFTWFYNIIGSVFVGLWKLVVKPVGKFALLKIKEWVKKI